MHYTRLVLCALIALSFLPTNAHAYFCWGPQKPREFLKDADLVFTGTVKEKQQLPATQLELNTPRELVTFEIEKLWKGPDDITRLVGVDVEGIYEYDFKENTKYLVYAYNLYSPRYTIVGCPRVKEAEEAKKDIAKLGTGYRSVSRVTSRVKFKGPDAAESEEEELPEEELEEIEEVAEEPATEQPAPEAEVSETEEATEAEPVEEAVEDAEEIIEEDTPPETEEALEDAEEPSSVPVTPTIPTIPRVKR